MGRPWTWSACAALFVLAGGACAGPFVPERPERVTTLVVTAALQPDGAIDMGAEVTFQGEGGGVVALRVPVLAQLSEVRVDGSRRSESGSGGSTVRVTLPGPTATIAYRITGATERWADVALVEIPLWAPQPGASVLDPRVSVGGTVSLPAPADAEAQWHRGVNTSLRHEGDRIAFAGEVVTTVPSHLMVAVPPTLVPEAALVSSTQEHRPIYDERRARQEEANRQFQADASRRDRLQDLAVTGYWALLAFLVALPFLVVGVRSLRAVGIRVRAARGVPTYLPEKPGDEDPGLVALLMADGHDVGSEAVAGTLLDLAARKVVSLEGIDSERYHIRVGTTASGELGTEAALLEALGEVAGSDGAVTGPPLPLPRTGHWWRAYRRDLAHRARRGRLVQRRYRSGIFIGSVAVLLVVAWPLFAHTPETAFGGVLVAIVLSMLPFFGGFVLTASGHRAKAQWRAFARHVRDFSEMEGEGAPAVAVWGPYIAYGAATGVARKAVAALSPRGRARPRVS